MDCPKAECIYRRNKAQAFFTLKILYENDAGPTSPRADEH